MKYVDMLLIYTDQNLFWGTSPIWYDRQLSMVRNLHNTSMSLQFTEYDCKLTMGLHLTSNIKTWQVALYAYKWTAASQK